jgi:hypothetical protein
MLPIGLWIMDNGAVTKDLILEHQEICIRGCEEFAYLEIKNIDKEGRQENVTLNRTNKLYPPGRRRKGRSRY